MEGSCQEALGPGLWAPDVCLGEAAEQTASTCRTVAARREGARGEVASAVGSVLRNNRSCLPCDPQVLTALQKDSRDMEKGSPALRH